MTTNLTALFDRLAEVTADSRESVTAIKREIQALLNARYDDWKALQTALKDLENCNGVEYCTDEYGDAVAWVRMYDLTIVPKDEREYLEEYLTDSGVYVDWTNEVISQSFGSDEIYINDSGHRRDRGVYQSGRMIIEEDAYRDEDTGEIDEDRRNTLIEEHMEKTGVFPGVFRTSYHDNSLFPVNTQKKLK